MSVTKVTRLQGYKAPGGKHYRLRAASGRYGVTGAAHRRGVPMETGWRWYVLIVAPGSEFVTQRRLTCAGFDTFLPLLHVRKRSDPRFALARPRLPGYLFLGANEQHTLPWSEIMAIKGIVGVADNDGEPYVVSAQQMWKLVLANQKPRHVRGGAAKVRSKGKKTAGAVEILSGPYAGSVVRVIDTDEGEALYAFNCRSFTLTAESALYSVNGGKM